MNRQQKVKKKKQQKQQHELSKRRLEREELQSIGVKDFEKETVPHFPGFRPGIVPKHMKKKMEKSEDEITEGPESFMTGQS